MSRHLPTTQRIPPLNFTHLLTPPSDKNNNTGMSHPFRMSIFLLCLLVGVAVSRYINDDDDASEFLQPIISQTRQRRICAELCMAGLGGDPCGEGCVDLIPDGMPVQYAQTEQNNKTIPNVSYMTRHDMCDVLCNNNLGNPLCQCNNTGIVKQKSNFFEGEFNF